MKRRVKLLICGAILMLIAANFTGCDVIVSTCSTPLCNNDAQLFRDLCSRCRDIADRIDNIFN